MTKFDLNGFVFGHGNGSTTILKDRVFMQNAAKGILKLGK